MYIQKYNSKITGDQWKDIMPIIDQYISDEEYKKLLNEKKQQDFFDKEFEKFEHDWIKLKI
jgi:hypothetical protein